MKYTQNWIITQKNKNAGIEATSHDLCLRAGLIHQVSAGIYDFLPLGQRVLSKIEGMVREEMNNAGALEISVPIVQIADLWKESGRWDQYGSELLRFKNRENRDFCLSPTAEEMVTELVRTTLKSYKQLPVTLYQIGRKYRDEMRPKNGLLRAREFIMKDAYSFDLDENGLARSYSLMRDAYVKIFSRLGLKTLVASADTGPIGGKSSEEFLAPAAIGEDKFRPLGNGKALKTDDPTAETAIELGHVFKLGDRYSKSMNLNYYDIDNKQKTVLMGCYGIGITRALSAIIEQNHDKHGIIWPKATSPYDVLLLPTNTSYETNTISLDLYKTLKLQGIDVLLDDRTVAAGIKFHDADLIGIPLKIIVGNKATSEGKVDFEARADKKKTESSLTDVVQTYFDLSKGL
ncbi:proline--tRNA ligase [Candidatus Woesebacteria bacterium RBG_13_36_22]|uniref:Proline--tRNA ligase n=1 Tax=Candidatus Woesebacteria bacterium RBG_13_36_22 TaxID=1802478 RepID=A0A1F7X012_9BACT|nr:MAG: proline--tRNA ligase [Candidatus Woesebacteria bacterium RBG_13_36_22]